MIEAWIVVTQSVLNALWTIAKSENPPANFKLLTNGVRGYWSDISPFEVVNVIGTQQEIDDLINLLGAGFVSIDSWYQGKGFDYNENVSWLTDPNRILTLMPGAPTFNNPNWSHVFLGQNPEDKIFAGQFSDNFSTEYL